MEFVLIFAFGLFSGITICLLLDNIKKENTTSSVEENIDLDKKEIISAKGMINKLNHLLDRRKRELEVIKNEWAEQSSLKKYVELFKEKESVASKDKENNQDLLSQISFELDKYTSPDSIQEDISEFEKKIRKLEDFISTLEEWIKEEEKKL